MLPNIITYSDLISTCEKGKQPEPAHELLLVIVSGEAVSNS